MKNQRLRPFETNPKMYFFGKDVYISLFGTPLPLAMPFVLPVQRVLYGFCINAWMKRSTRSKQSPGQPHAIHEH